MCVLCPDTTPALSYSYDFMLEHLEQHWDKDKIGYNNGFSERNKILCDSDQCVQKDVVEIVCHSLKLSYLFQLHSHPAEIQFVLGHGELPPCARSPELQLAVVAKCEQVQMAKRKEESERVAKHAAKRQKKDEAAKRTAGRQKKKDEAAKRTAERQKKKDEAAERQKKKDEEAAERQKKKDEAAERQKKKVEEAAERQRKRDEEAAKRQKKKDKRAAEYQIKKEKQAARLKRQSCLTYKRKEELRVERMRQRTIEFQKKLDDFAANPIIPAPAIIAPGDSRIFFMNARQQNLSKVLKHLDERTSAGYGAAVVAIADYTHNKTGIIEGWTHVNTIPYKSGRRTKAARLAVFWRTQPGNEHISCFDMTAHTITLTIGSQASTRQLQMVFAYLPPRDTLCDILAIAELADSIRKCHCPVIVAGDLNASLGKLVGDTRACARRTHLKLIFKKYPLEIFNTRIPGAPMPTFSKSAINKPTVPGHTATIIDYLFVGKDAVDAVSNFHLVDTYDVYESETTTWIKSDHRALEFDLTMPTEA
ncbi:hypothetical protein LPJ71_000577 [Coemansia sp. S17]|nr:hypothetical protein LPJ71_000577 [Coemansia sp. S17]